MGVVHHAVYLVWFEEARTALSRALGVPYADWERRGLFLMVGTLSCRYRRPARYDEEVTVWVRVAEVASRRITFEYRVEGANGAVLADGQTRHVVVDRTSGRPVALPPDLRAALNRTLP
jgi:acyl-CoA thioester hydrolase